MPSPSAAEEHLRVIRSLMEKATVYRAISAQAALVAGAVACVVGFGSSALGIASTGALFIWKWLGVVSLSAAANFFFLYRDSVRRGEPFISAGMRMALCSMWGPLLCGAVTTFVLSPTLIVPFWMIFYGLSLLSSVHFAPRSLKRLGTGFLLLGLAALIAVASSDVPALVSGDILMAGTFGVLHVLYAAYTWPRSQAVVEAAS